MGKEVESKASLIKVLMSLKDLEAYKTQAFFWSLDDLQAIASKEHVPMNWLKDLLRSANGYLPQFTGYRVSFREYVGLFETLVGRVLNGEVPEDEYDLDRPFVQFTEDDFVELVWPVMRHAMEINSGEDGQFAPFYSGNLRQSLRELNLKLTPSIRERLQEVLTLWVAEDEAKRKPYLSALDI